MARSQMQRDDGQTPESFSRLSGGRRLEVGDEPAGEDGHR